MTSLVEDLRMKLMLALEFHESAFLVEELRGSVETAELRSSQVSDDSPTL
jgi:hypothetical protein